MTICNRDAEAIAPQSHQALGSASHELFMYEMFCSLSK